MILTKTFLFIITVLKVNNVELGKLALFYGLKNNGSDTILIGMNTRKLLNYNLEVLRKGISDKEAEVYNEIKM